MRTRNKPLNSPDFTRTLWLFGLICILLTTLSACAAGRTTTLCPDCTYTGDTQNDMKHGHGTALYNNGDKYTGQFENDKRHGQGTFTWANGDVYEGQWVNGEREGQGTMTFHTGDKYVGTWKNDAMHGEGVFTWDNGDVYEGSFVRGKRHGEGTLTHADGSIETGEWVENQLPPLKENETPGRGDSDPPVIRITSHQMFRGITIVPVVPHIQVTGIAEDESGVAGVTVNGNPAKVDSSGRFSIKLPLKEGRNEVNVVARDTRENESTKMFWVESKDERPPERVTSGEDEDQNEDDGSLKTGRYHALIIGINNYRHLPRLETAVNDAKEVDRLLKREYGFTTTVLLNADRSEIMNGFNEVREMLTAEDNLLIYYAGHGDFDKDVNKAYWLPVDAQPDNDTNWIIVDNITTNIRRMATKHVLIVADSCYSGTLTRSALTRLTSAEEKHRFLKKMLDRPSRTLMSSGGNEPVADGGGSGHSVFANVFLRSLTSADTTTFTAEQLFHGYIKEAVAGQAQQVPEYNVIKNSGHAGGDFVFIRRR